MNLSDPSELDNTAPLMHSILKFLLYCSLCELMRGKGETKRNLNTGAENIQWREYHIQNDNTLKKTNLDIMKICKTIIPSICSYIKEVTRTCTYREFTIDRAGP